MVSPVTITETTAAHIRELGQNMRAADAREATCLGFIPHRLLWRSYKGSLMCKAAIVGDQVAGVWGVYGSPFTEIGRPWLITSEAVKLRSPLDYALLYRQEVKKMRKLFPMLENWVDASYTESVRLMSIVGFNVDEAMPYGPKGCLFRRFWLKSEMA